VARHASPYSTPKKAESIGVRLGNQVSFPRRRSTISRAKILIVFFSLSLKVLKKISPRCSLSLKVLKNHLNPLQDVDCRLFVITESIEKDITLLFVITESIEKSNPYLKY
jgi:hypothetical protein